MMTVVDTGRLALFSHLPRSGQHGDCSAQRVMRYPVAARCKRKLLSRHAVEPGMSLDVVRSYQQLLEAFPLATKAATSSVMFGIGDCIAQARSPNDNKIDVTRLGRYMVTGFGSGVLWTFYYDAADIWASQASNDAMARILFSMGLEQFAWCPILYAFYVLPMSVLLNGGVLADIPKEIRERLPGLLVANAKVWTPANLLIYNVPLELRVVTANAVDIVWASFCSNVAAECGTDADEACSVSLTQITRRQDGKVPDVAKRDLLSEASNAG